MSTYYGARYCVIRFPSAVLSTQQSYEVDIITMLQMSKLRLGEVKWHVQDLNSQAVMESGFEPKSFQIQ